MEAAFNVIKIFVLGSFAFISAFLWTPFLTDFLYKRRLWKKTVRTKALDGTATPVFQKFHTDGETRVPRFGGLLIWVTTLVLIYLVYGLSRITDIWWLKKMNFLSRQETWLPLFALISASLLGLIDDILQVQGKGKYIGGGLSLKKRLVIVALIGLVGGLWFYFKLDWHILHIPGGGNIEIGAWYVLLFVLVTLATYSGGVIDGLDGLAGGTFVSMFGAFAVIAFAQDKIDLAAFSIVIAGTILAFLWFNIPPARFYMGETGSMGLCATLTVIAFLTDSVLVLPIIGGLLVLESASVIIQLISKKFYGRKFFLAAPIHLHLQAIGWPSYRITMRFWVIGVVLAIVGTAIRLLG